MQAESVDANALGGRGKGNDGELYNGMKWIFPSLEVRTSTSMCLLVTCNPAPPRKMLNKKQMLTLNQTKLYI